MHRVGSKLFVLKLAQAAQRAYPDVALRVFVDRSHKVIRQPLSRRVNIETLAS